MPAILRDNPYPLGEGEDDDIETLERRVSAFRQALAKAGVSTSSPKVLEIGCGNGNFLAALRKCGFDVVGVEIRPRGEYATGVVSARVERMPFSDAAFDVVFSSLVFDIGAYDQDQRSMMREIARVLKPHGVYVSRGDEIKARSKYLVLAKRLRHLVPINVYRKR